VRARHPHRASGDHAGTPNSSFAGQKDLGDALSADHAMANYELSHEKVSITTDERTELTVENQYD